MLRNSNVYMKLSLTIHVLLWKHWIIKKNENLKPEDKKNLSKELQPLR